MDGDDMVGEAEAVTARELVIILGQYHSAIARLGSGIISWPACSDVVKTPM